MIKSTATTTNLEVILPQSQEATMSVDIMQERLVDAGNRLGLYVSHVTTLGRKKYPGNRHWHLKRMPHERGCLDVTYWPRDVSSHGEFSIMWISMRHREPEWVHEFGRKLKVELEVGPP